MSPKQWGLDAFSKGLFSTRTFAEMDKYDDKYRYQLEAEELAAMETHTAPIVGAHFRPPAKIILQHLPAKAKLVLVPEPANQYDPNAIAVFVSPAEISLAQDEELSDDLALTGGVTLQQLRAQPFWQLGYIKATAAAEVIGALNSALNRAPDGTEFWPAVLSFDITGKPLADFSLPEAL